MQPEGPLGCQIPVMIFLFIIGVAALFAAAHYWDEKKREAQLLARLDKLRDCPEAVTGMVDDLIARRKRQTEALDRVRRNHLDPRNPFHYP